MQPLNYVLSQLEFITDNGTHVTHLLKSTFSTGIVPQKGLVSRESITDVHKIRNWYYQLSNQ